MCVRACASGNRVKSSAESGLFCVSQPVTSKLGAGHKGEGHLLSSSLSLSPSLSLSLSLSLCVRVSGFTLPSIRFTSHPDSCAHHFLSFNFFVFVSNILCIYLLILLLYFLSSLFLISFHHFFRSVNKLEQLVISSISSSIEDSVADYLTINSSS